MLFISERPVYTHLQSYLQLITFEQPMKRKNKNLLDYGVQINLCDLCIRIPQPHL